MILPVKEERQKFGLIPHSVTKSSYKKYPLLLYFYQVQLQTVRKLEELTEDNTRTKIFLAGPYIKFTNIINSSTSGSSTQGPNFYFSTEKVLQIAPTGISM